MLLASVLLVCLTVVAATPVAHLFGARAGWLLCWPLLISAGILVYAYLTSPGEVIEFYPWIPGLMDVGFHLRLTGLSLSFSLLVLVIGAGVLFYSAGYLGRTKVISFYLLMTTFALAMLVLVLANDLMVFYVAWEATTFSSFFLIARSGAHARQPAIRTLLVTVAGGLSLLTAVCIMIIKAGTTVLSEVLADPMWNQSGLTILLAILIALAAFTKSAQFPFQSWLPDSMVAISPVSAYLHAAAMVKAGVFLFLLFSPVLANVLTWNLMLIIAGLTTAIVGAVSALRRYDLKELLAYSTMSQLGYLVALIGVGTPASLTAAIVHTFAHALFKSALFLAVGIIDHQSGTRDMRMLAVRKLHLPAVHTTVILAAASMAGLPPFLGFVSKESLFEAFLNTDLPAGLGIVVIIAGVIAALFTFAYSGRLVMGALGKYRSPKEWVNIPRSTSDSKLVTDGGFTFYVVPLVNAFLGLALGMAPFLLNGLVRQAGADAVGAPVTIDFALWHGVNTALLISLGVIALGSILVWQSPRIEAFMVPRPFPIYGLAVVEKTRTGIINFGAAVGELTSGLNPGRHLLVPSAALGLITVAGLFGIKNLPAQQPNLDRGTDWLLVLLVAAGVVATVRASTRISALVVVGVVGFSVTLWFFALGSVDVALTQLLVEILTVVVMVLLLKRLPMRFSRQTTAKSMPAIIAAIVAGVSAFFGVWALTGRRGMSEPAEYYTKFGTEVSGGNNLVNVILVEFRALDTLGELTVLGVAGLAVAALLASRKPDSVKQSAATKTSPLSRVGDNLVFLRTFTYVAAPVLVVLSLITLVRGHNEPGGGFIAALLGGATFSLIYLSARSDDTKAIRWPYFALIGAGVSLGAGVGVWGLVSGSFLTPLTTDLWGLHLNSALLFDLGVYLAVLGLVLAAFNLLGRKDPHELMPAPPRADPLLPHKSQETSTTDETKQEVAR